MVKASLTTLCMLCIVLCLTNGLKEYFGTRVTYNEECKTAINSDDTYYCALNDKMDHGYSCDLTLTKEQCIDANNYDYYECSNESTKHPEDSAFILCPESHTCGDLEHHDFMDYGETLNFETYPALNEDHVCKFSSKISQSLYRQVDSSKLKITVESLTNAAASLYLYNDLNDTFTFETSLSQSDIVYVTITRNQHAYVLVNPYDDASAYVKMETVDPVEIVEYFITFIPVLVVAILLGVVVIVAIMYKKSVVVDTCDGQNADQIKREDGKERELLVNEEQQIMKKNGKSGSKAGDLLEEEKTPDNSNHGSSTGKKSDEINPFSPGNTLNF